MWSRYWNQATPKQRRAGLRWYARARGEVRTLAHDTGTGESVAAGVVAALSVRQRWDRNLALARVCLRGGRVRGVLPWARTTAYWIRRGADPDTVLAMKTRAFYRALLGERDAVVLDVWMWRGAGRNIPTRRQAAYDRYATVLRREAARAGVAPVHYQAVVWVVLRSGAT